MLMYLLSLGFCCRDHAWSESEPGITDESDLLVGAVGLEDLKLRVLTTGRATEILAKAAKGRIPQAK